MAIQTNIAARILPAPSWPTSTGVTIRSFWPIGSTDHQIQINASLQQRDNDALFVRVTSSALNAG